MSAQVEQKSKIGENRRCRQCNKIALYRCNGCQEVYYCSRKCENQSWDNHIVSCGKLDTKVIEAPQPDKMIEASVPIRSNVTPSATSAVTDDVKRNGYAVVWCLLERA